MQVFGADDLEWTGNVSSRLLRLGWLFFILITISSYTANLASFFTAVNFEIVGPQDMTALQSATVCLPDHANDEAHLERTQTKYGVGSVLGGLVTAFMPPDFAGKSDEEKLECCWSKTPHELVSRCAEKVRNGEADVLLADRIGLTSWLLDRAHPDRCANFTWSAGIALPYGNPRQIFLALNRTAGFALFSNVQVALGWLRQQAPAEKLGRIYQNELRFGEGCPARGSRPSERIGLESQLGVFVIVGTLLGGAVLSAAVESRIASRTKRKVEDAEADETAMLTDGEMMREVYKFAVRERQLRDNSETKVETIAD